MTLALGWGWGEVGFWLLLAVVVFAALLGVVLWLGRGEGGSAAREPAAPAPAPPAPAPRGIASGDVIAVVTFPRLTGAERAYADARDRAGPAAWLQEVAFVESHRHGRIVVRGTFAGHYLDVDDIGDVIGRETAVDAVAGALVGLAFGPPGFAVGLVGGGIAGGVRQAHHLPALDGALLEEIRADVPVGASALVLLASAADAEAMAGALGGSGGNLVRHPLSPGAAAAFEAAVSEAPAAHRS